MIKTYISGSIVPALILAGYTNVLAGWQDYLPKNMDGLLGQPETHTVASQLSQSEMVAGLIGTWATIWYVLPCQIPLIPSHKE